MRYADVIVDNNTNATDELYTYVFDEDALDLHVGSCVKVPFSIHNRLIDGFVTAIAEQPPKEGIRFKKISGAGEHTDLNEEIMSTAVWIKNRYLCRYIEAVKLFLPTNTEVKRKTKDPFENVNAEPDSPKVLNDEQTAALKEIDKAIGERSNTSFLIHGVTGSGKTEVYLQAAAENMRLGRQTIILVPEIALTPQTVSRFVARFGREQIAILHSKLTPAQRSVEYSKIASGQVSVVIGARSAILAPFENIGLIIIDEEHETSYKSDKNPKYDAIELAFFRAKNHEAVMLLGSATPSVNDYYRSENGVFKRLELKERYNKNPLPDVSIVDMSLEVRRGNRNIFSGELANAIAENLEKKKQVILFLNRRGYSSFVSCRECGYTVKCPECGIAMTYHKGSNACVCHYCGRKVEIPKVCPECGSKIIGRYGVGTEQVEEKVKELFPNAKTERLDLDTIKKKGELESILKRFGSGKTDILIGTQLVAKGLDFANVGLVGIVSADVTLNIPDFRSSERTFQLVTQAAGRSGRGDNPGKVIIQTYQPEAFAIIAAANHDYKGFYEREISIRESIAYPPYADIFRLLISDEDKSKAEAYANKASEWIKKRMPEGTFVLGPTQTALLKVDGLYRYQILIKVSKGGRKYVAQQITVLREQFEKSKNKAKLLTVDVNPYSFM